MERKPWTLERLWKTANNYWTTCALHAGVQTGLTALLAQEGAATAGDLAARLDLDKRGLGMLLTALASLGLLKKDGPVYSLAPEAVPWFLPDGPEDMSNYVMHMADMTADWAQLAQCIKSGRPVERKRSEDEKGPQPQRDHFYRAMRDLARRQASGLASRLGLKPGQRLLDLAGGPGVYGLTFAGEVEGLIATVFDLPQAERMFQEEAALHPAVQSRVRFEPGNFEQDPLGGPYDVVWLSQVLHSEGPQSCQRLLSKAANALAPGGALWVLEFVVDPEGRGHPLAALFSLNMLVNTQAGQSYSATELQDLMQGAGLTQVKYQGPLREGSPAGLIKGVKPSD
ncbi:MAG: methyltransferase [Desulfarculaceae bacterium]|jgi:ubiquinone/menaquinone biosynthesis C-methylase UbiE